MPKSPYCHPNPSPGATLQMPDCLACGRMLPRWRVVLRVVTGTLGGKKIALRGGGGWHGSPFAQPPPPPPWSPCREGGLGWGCPTCRAGGGGVRPQHTWLKMIPDHFDYTYVGEIFFVKKIFRAKICVPAPLVRPYTKQKARHGSPFLEPPPPLLRRAPMPSPPPAAKQFSGRPDPLLGAVQKRLPGGSPGR